MANRQASTLAVSLRVVLLLVLGLLGTPTRAHFPSGYDLRVVHFQRAEDGLHAYIRLTLPLVLGNRMGPKDGDGFAAPAPYTIRRIESAHAFYYPDVARIRRDPSGLAQLVIAGHRVMAQEQTLSAQLRGIRVYPKGTLPPFNTLQEAIAATQGGEIYPGQETPVDAAFVAVDSHLVYPGGHRVDGFNFSRTLSNAVIGQPEVQNLLLDHVDQRVTIYRRAGLLADGLEISPSPWRAATSFLRYGLEHVLHGLDHLLFVLCLALGAAGLSGLIWRVTGFTAGHAVSLGAGFFGYAPHQSWFIPAVETAIALSILLAATSLLFRRTGLRIVMALTIAVGLIHGLRFSFVLRDLLDTHGPPVIPSFAAFNLGVEAGQSIFAAAVFGIAAWIAHRSQPGHRRLQIAAALCCAVVALIWTFERGQALLI